MSRRSSALLQWYPRVKAVPKAPATLRRVTSRGRIRYQPRLGAGYTRERSYSRLEAIINTRAREEAQHLGVSVSWLVATILADAFKVNLDKKMRAYKPGG